MTDATYSNITVN